MSTLCAQYWGAIVELDQYCLDELLRYFWYNNYVSQQQEHKKPSKPVYSDAKGYGPIITLNEKVVSRKMWNTEEESRSSTWRELEAIRFSDSIFSWAA